MIGDVLTNAISEIDLYLQEYNDVYRGDVRERILTVLDAMRRLRDDLTGIDAVPET